MLLDLRVKDFAIIENIHIQFTEGFNVLSGETGAGKSVLLKSLALLMGGKASSESVRTDCDKASIEGFFDISGREDIASRLEEKGISVEESELIVCRVIFAQGKSRVYMNGTLVTLNDLREVVSPLIEVSGHSAPLIEMTGQHENKNLQSRSYHLEWLDQFAGVSKMKAAYVKSHEQVKKVESEIDHISSNQGEMAQRLDFIKYQLSEIEQLDMQPGEEESLEQQVSALKTVGKLMGFVSDSERALYGDSDSAMSRIDRVLSEGMILGRTDNQVEQSLDQLRQAKATLEDWLYSMQKHGTSMHLSEESSEVLESKLSRLRKLQKKYGESVAEILEQAEALSTEVSQLENIEQTLSDLNKQLREFQLIRKKCGDDLHNARMKKAEALTKEINRELLDLNMKGLEVNVDVQLSDEYLATGVSEVEFLSKTSKKDKFRSLSKFASGGELSRILLSIKQVIGSGSEPRTHLFDEVDTGVSGETAEKVGRKLKQISTGQQLVCVTHLPQVAAFADTHFLIEKSPKDNSVQMNVRSLTKKDRVDEVARLISGEKITKTSRDHAKELIQSTSV